MKKVLLSASFIILFAVYASLERTGGTTAAETILGNTTQNALPVDPSQIPTDQPSITPPAPAPKQNSDSAPANPTPTVPTPAPPPPQTQPTMSVPVVKPKPVTKIYNDGTYTGVSADAYYGNVQVQVSIQNGKIVDVIFLDYPQDRNTSRMINSQAMPYLKSEAIQAQNANVDIVSGATETSGAFIQSLASALAQARV